MASASSRRLKSIGRWLAAPLAVFLVGLFVLEHVNGSEASRRAHPPGAAAEAGANPALLSDPAAQIASLQSVLRENPSNLEAYGLLGDAYYQQFRETADPTLIQRAQQAFEAALAIQPRNEAAVIGQGTLALTRHKFHAGLSLGMKAHRLEPALVQPYNLIADAQIELGRYTAAGKTLQRFVDLRPSLASYSRVSYFRELNGDRKGAIQAMRLAVSTGGGGEPLAYVENLLGKLEFDGGDLGAASFQYQRAIEDNGTVYTPALAGLAQVAAARGHYDAAIRRYRKVVEMLPLPQYAIALAETELAAGRDEAAGRDLALVRVEERLFRAAGVDVGTELAIFEADHGSPRRAVAFGAESWRRAPSVRSADAYSWALHSAGRRAAATRMSRQAMRLGSRDPIFLYHAGQIARAGGDRDRAKKLLGLLVAQCPHFNPLYGPAAERSLASLR